MKKHSHPRMHDVEAPEDLPLFRCDAAQPAAPDGEEWEAQVLRLADELHERLGSLRPSELRAAAEQLGLIPHHPNRWGVIWARLKAAGWERTTDEVTSTSATRNGARESVWTRAS